MKPTKVRLFVKSYCPWCHRAAAWLDRRGVTYETIEVVGNPAAMDEMVALSDQDSAPVIEVDGKILADFGPDELDDWWHKQKFHKE
jgi:glutaredoxin 3